MSATKKTKQILPEFDLIGMKEAAEINRRWQAEDAAQEAAYVAAMEADPLVRRWRLWTSKHWQMTFEAWKQAEALGEIYGTSCPCGCQREFVIAG